MCDIKDGFKLCTCASVDENKTHWQLIRLAEDLVTVVGMPAFSKVQQLADYNWVLDQLNGRPCFDFDYQPQHKDRLLLKVLKDQEMITLCFDYYKNEFRKGWEINYIFHDQAGRTFNKGIVRANSE